MSDPNEACPALYHERYGSEWKDPDVASCAGAPTLGFNGSQLTLTLGDGSTKTYPADSGKIAGRTEEGDLIFDYSDARQRLGSTGPIPEGAYWINPDELAPNYLNMRYNSDAWGGYRITIHPSRKTDTHCRGGFFIHGGKYRGSAGCIDLTQHISRFVGDLKRAVGGGTPACAVPLTVSYP